MPRRQPYGDLRRLSRPHRILARQVEAGDRDVARLFAQVAADVGDAVRDLGPDHALTDGDHASLMAAIDRRLDRAFGPDPERTAAGQLEQLITRRVATAGAEVGMATLDRRTIRVIASDPELCRAMGIDPAVAQEVARGRP